MLKTNSKKARENIKKYILSKYDFAGYDLPTTGEFADVAQKIYNIFNKEVGQFRRVSEAKAFEEWTADLPSALDTADYYYAKSAVDVLGEILEESQEERKKYTEAQAEKMLTYLIYKGIKGAVNA